MRGLSARPIFSYAHDHYYRVFFKVSKSVVESDEILGEIEYFLIDKSALEWHFLERDSVHRWRDGDCSGSPEELKLAGPLFTGKLIRSDIAGKMDGSNLDVLCKGMKKAEKHVKLLGRLAGEANAMPFFYCTHEMGRRIGGAPPPMKIILEKLKEKGISGFRTHFSPTGLKLDEKHLAGRDSIRDLIGTLFKKE